MLAMQRIPAVLTARDDDVALSLSGDHSSLKAHRRVAVTRGSTPSVLVTQMA